MVATSARWTSSGSEVEIPFGIDRGVVQPFRLQENLVPVALAEAHDLVLDRRAIARPAARDLAGIHRRAMHVGADDPMRGLGGPGDAALDLRVRRSARSAPKTAPAARRRAAFPAPPSRWCGRRAAAACRSSGGRARSPAAPASRESPSAGASPTRPAGDLPLADVDQPAQERAGGQHHGAAAGNFRPSASLSPQTRPSAQIRSSASPSITVRFAVFSIASCMAAA